LAGPGACKANCRGTCAIFSDKVGARCSTGALPSQEDEATFGPSDDVQEIKSFRGQYIRMRYEIDWMNYEVMAS